MTMSNDTVCKTYKHKKRKFEATELKDSDMMKLVILDYLVPYITEIPRDCVVGCDDREEVIESDWIDDAYQEFIELLDRDATESEDFREAIEKHMPKQKMFTNSEIVKRAFEKDSKEGNSSSLLMIGTLTIFLRENGLLLSTDE